MIRQLVALSPFVVMTCTTVAAVLSAGRDPSRYCITVGILSTLLLILSNGVSPLSTDLIVVDRFFILHASLVLLSGLMVTTSRRRPSATDLRRQDTFCLLLPTILTGGMLLCGSGHLTTTLIGVEMLALSLVGLLGCTSRRDALPVAIRYALLSASFALLLSFGAALVYMRTGTLSYRQLILRPTDDQVLSLGEEPICLLGMGMLTTALGFKLALAPFHSWILAVRRASLFPVPDLLVTVVKTAALAALVRLFLSTSDSVGMRTLLLGIASISACGGGLLSMMQEDVRDLMICSSTLNLGSLLVGCALGEQALAVESVNIFLINYVLVNLSVFALIRPLCRRAENLTLRGLSHQDAARSAALVLSFLSAAGLPPTVGFVGNLCVIRNCLQGGVAWICGVIILGKVLGFCSYLRFLLNMFSTAGRCRPRFIPEEKIPPHVLILLLLIVGLGIYPQPLISLARTSLPALRRM